MSEGAQKSDLVDLTLHLHIKTERAIRVSETGDDAKAVWLPLSQCEVEKGRNGTVIVTAPGWLALKKGLI